MTRRRLLGAAAGVLVAVVVVVGGAGLVRWNAAGTAHEITPPADTGTSLPVGAYRTDVETRAAIIAIGLRTDRGNAFVRTYALPPNSPWLRARQSIATQLDHWEQAGDCADRPQARIVECTWREPTRWWPREVRLTMMRPPAGPDRDGWPDLTILLIGSGRGD